MNIQVTSERVENDQISAKVSVSASDVTRAINDTYTDISRRYNFQGFRRGHVPRPVIDGMIGRAAVLAQATNTLLEQLDPELIETLDVVPLEEISYGDDAAPVVAGSDYEVVATIHVCPQATLNNYEAPAIEMPPSEPTEAEIDEQIDLLLSYHVTYDDVEEDREVQASDIVSINIENIENAEGYAGEGRLLNMSENGMPSVFDEAILGMKKGDSKEVSWSHAQSTEDGTHEVIRKAKITLVTIKTKNVPELTEDFVQTRFGFESVEELRDAVRSEIVGDKAYSLPNLKENRVLDAITARLDLDEVPEAYTESVYKELIQDFLERLQRQGTTLDSYLEARSITTMQFIEDARNQAVERARQSLALDALAAHLEIKITEDDLKEEFENSASSETASLEDFRSAGRLPAVREAMRRNRALMWLVEHAEVTEVDEVAQRRAGNSAESEVETTAEVAPAESEVETAAEDAPAESEAAPEPEPTASAESEPAPEPEPEASAESSATEPVEADSPVEE